MKVPKLFGEIHWLIKEKIDLFHKRFVLLSTKQKVKYYEKRYYKKFGFKLNINNPKTFYDKINNLKFYKFDPIMTSYTDKITAKDIASKFVGNCKIARVLKTFDSFKTFKRWCKNNSFEKNQVLKTNNGSGAVFFFDKIDGQIEIRDKHGKRVDRSSMKKAVRKSLKVNWYYAEFEQNYKFIKPIIFIEEYFPSVDKKGLNEYKFFCNFGEVKLINVVYSRQDGHNLKEVFTDSNLCPLPVRQGRSILNKNDIIKPKYFDEMLSFASFFSKNFPFLRVDLMCDSDNYYFCEFTFYDFGGLSCFLPLESNYLIGNMFSL